MTLESFTVNAHYGMSEILEKAGLNTLLGMGTVFVMLIFMSFIISLIKYVPALLNGTSKKKKEEAPKAAPAPAVAAAVEEAEEMDDTELVAVIAAAIAAAEGTTTDGFVVRSIKRRKSNKAAPKAAPKAASKAAPKAAAGAGSIKVEAGAAGKVFKIEASVGQKVSRGDAVLIVEAMKMEIPVVAPEDGTVASIDVAVGDAVEAGQTLATLN